ncbi:7-carboxy-7-deazaguanine synthase QueE [Acididesulfobacillus acetoxydans]|uniref:7-carboxy-7-deazaguanine synthase QueE n=1 Tax=Acididesulfobacillus acetoxydans TaxID=1561005 RepID=UPI001F1158A1|nr:7-carboxy-7-deazaguanine synthase QueE [Acididesulfobacillus acetoxydans]
MTESYPVSEIFESIQGEGIWTGIPAAFVRLQGCNLRCGWCDTKEAWSGKASNLTAKEILAEIHLEHVIVTGGEPLLHDLNGLFAALQHAGKKIHVETNGTQPWRESYPPDIWLTVSPKEESGYAVHPSLPERVGEYKFVVDEAFRPEVIRKFYTRQEHRRQEPLIFLSPENVRPEMVEKAFQMVLEYPFCRLMVQMHKLIGVR